MCRVHSEFFVQKSNKTCYKCMKTAELIEHAQRDDYQALEELIKKEQKGVYASFYYLAPDRNDLLDLTQEALWRMSKNIKRLKSPQNFKSWLSHIITNLFYDQLRKKKRVPDVVSIDTHWNNEDETCPVYDIKDKKAKPEDKSLSRELSEVIRETIRNLPEHFRFVIILRELQGLSYEEIADITNTNVGTVKSRIARARNKLQEELKGYIM